MSIVLILQLVLVLAILLPAAGAADALLLPDRRDVAYGEHPAQVFDYYRAVGPGPHPVAVAIHGGGFCAGSKDQLDPILARELLDAGISVVAIGYRLSHVAPYPAAMLDAARAVQFLREHAADFALDADRLATYGGSAGGGISLWLATHDDLVDEMADDPVARRSTRPRCAVGLDAQCSYDPRLHARFLGEAGVDPAMQAFFGMRGPEDLHDPAFAGLFEAASPITHLDRDDPPMLMTFQLADVPVSRIRDRDHLAHHPIFGHTMRTAAEAVGASVEVLRREDLAEPFDANLRFAVVAFILRHLSA